MGCPNSPPPPSSKKKRDTERQRGARNFILALGSHAVRNLSCVKNGPTSCMLSSLWSIVCSEPHAPPSKQMCRTMGTETLVNQHAETQSLIQANVQHHGYRNTGQSTRRDSETTAKLNAATCIFALGAAKIQKSLLRWVKSPIANR